MPEEPLAASGSKAGRVRILLVEDEETLAEIEQTHLELCGHRVEIARDGEAALHAIQSQEFDFIFCDLTLPGNLDGYAVASAIRDDPAYSRLVIVALTAHRPEDVTDSPRGGAFHAVLTKPLSTEDLSAVVQLLPERRRPERGED